MSLKTIVITGANAGIGYETALGIAKTGARVVLIGRDADKCETARQKIVAQTHNEQVHVLLADLMSHQSIRDFADEFKRRYDRLDVLINNAGGIFKQRQLTPDGMERTIGLNHFGYFLTTHYLHDILTQTPQSRLVNVASEAHRFVSRIKFEDLMLEKKYNEWTAYGQSKLANILFTRYLAVHWQQKGIATTANCLHPGTVRTNFGAKDFWFIRWTFRYLPLFKSAEQGAATSIYLAQSAAVAHTTGAYFDNCRERKSTKAGQDIAAMQQLWDTSLALTGLSAFGQC